MKINFGVIGTNVITERFLEAGKDAEGFCLRGVYSRSREKAVDFARKHGADLAFDSLEDMASCKEIDAVYVASPNSLHASQSIQMLKGGKHVLCEKPIASNQREFEEMKKAALEKRRILLEAMRSVYSPGFQAIRENLHKLGKIRRVSFQYCQYSRRYDNFKKGIIENAFNPALSNGALMDIGVYCVHPLVSLFGKPEKVISSSLKLSNGIDGAGTILTEYPDFQGELLYSKITDSRVPSQIQGEEGSMIIEEIPDTVNIKIRTRKDKAWEEIKIDKKENNMYYEIEEFIRLIENGESAEKHNQYSLWELAVMDEARKQIGIVFPADQ